MTIDTELSDFNWHFLSQYGRIKFYAAGRFWDARAFDNADIDPYRLACEYYARHGFNVEPQDFYRQGNRIKYKSIDELVAENPAKLSDVGQVLFDGWLGMKAKLAAERGEQPQLPKIEPPPPAPPKPEPKLPEVRVPQPKKNPNPNLVRFSVYFSALAGVASIVSFFVPGAKPFVVAVVAIIKGILTALGV